MAGSVLDAVRDGALLATGEQLLVLVSGGRDSVCLLDVATTLATPERVSALHVNYGLRGEESEGDERHVRELCAALGVALNVERSPAPPASGNLQAWARDIRYARASLLATGSLIATGHTADDQVETVLYRLAASPGRRALLGMAPREGRLIRPLLGITRVQTETHCRERGLSWRDDSSNDGERYMRGRVRHALLPALRSLHPAAEDNVLRTAEILRAEAAVLDEAVLAALGGEARIERARLEELAPALARLVVIRLAEDAAGAPLPAVGGRLGELLALAASPGSAKLDVGAGVQAISEYGVLRFARSDAAPAPGRPTTLSVPGEASFGAWTLSATFDEQEPVAGHVARIDADRLSAPSLSVRPWRAGDRMRPLGLDGSRSLSDLFVDRRVPREQRRELPVVLDADEIAWIPGVASAERLRVGPATRRAAFLCALRA